MDTNISALMARIQEIRTRMQELQGLTAAGMSARGAKTGDAAAGSGGTESYKSSGFSDLLEQALGELGSTGSSGIAGVGDITGAMDLMSSALNSLTASADSEEDEESGFLMSTESLSRLTELERVLRRNLDDSTSGE